MNVLMTGKVAAPPPGSSRECRETEFPRLVRSETEAFGARSARAISLRGGRANHRILRMSDHLPIWIQIKTDIDGFGLNQIVQAGKE